MQLRAKDMSIMKDEERQRRRRRIIDRRNAKWYDPVFEKRGSRIAKKYCGSFLFDGLFIYNFVACAPVLAYEAYYGFSTDYEVKWDKIHTLHYQLFMAFKLFKIVMLVEISNQWQLIEDVLKEYFVTSKLTIENTTNFLKAVFAFLAMLHVFACAWIWIGALSGENQWMEDNIEIYLEDEETTYVNAFYFIATTMTQIGYGDVDVFWNSGTQEFFGYGSIISVMIFQFAGILGFAIIKQQVFSYKLGAKMSKIIKQQQTEVETIMFRLDRVRKAKLPEYMYNDAIGYMRTVVQFSIRESFAENEFWRDLHPQL